MSDNEKFAAFIASMRHVINDSTLPGVTWITGEDMDRTFNERIDSYVNVAKRQAMKLMQEMIDARELYSQDELNNIFGDKA